MGFWYFLIAIIGVVSLLKGFVGERQVGFILTGILLIGLSLFMFQDGSAEIVADLFNL